MRVRIRGARLVDPRRRQEEFADLLIADGRIVGRGPAPDFHADQTIEAEGLVVCPGLIDTFARLREPGFEYRATLASELEAAVGGGITRVVTPPDTDPPLDEAGLVEMLRFRSEALGLARVYPVGALTLGLKGERLAEMVLLTEVGCVALGQADVPIADTLSLFRAFQYAATFDLPVWLTASDPWLAAAGCAHDGEVAARLGLPGIPACTETIALARLLELARATGVRLHVQHLSSAASLPLLAQAKASGLPVSASVSALHLACSEHDIGHFDTHTHVIPPLRSQADRAALAQAVAEGLIDVIDSNHTPVDDDAKAVPFAESEPGATGLELLLPLTLAWGREQGLGLAEALAPITDHPARLLGMEDTGHLGEGAVADLCLFDPQARWQVTPESLASLGKNTPLLGQTVQGRVVATLVGGRPVFSR
ncbi:dihydroorotase [Tepidiphilus baoligensis]|uniref:Dihydroorotase n=1 Tax=Tepidiphilus baoligensis TaxID=2698687 RepID=A0ABX1QPV5_9PROT|nr:dihydroorotase [Tepidiphilus baoligensis]NMH17131.1 dihydroorotase [Tepidiphilus baoligensis]